MGIYSGRLLGLVVLAGCGSTLGPGEPNFGAQYQVSAEPPPAITGTALTVTLQYGGCNGGHDFQLITRTRDLSAEVWLRKLTADQPCDMLVIEPRSFQLPLSVTEAASIALLAPNGEFRIR